MHIHAAAGRRVYCSGRGDKHPSGCRGPRSGTSEVSGTWRHVRSPHISHGALDGSPQQGGLRMLTAAGSLAPPSPQQCCTHGMPPPEPLRVPLIHRLPGLPVCRGGRAQERGAVYRAPWQLILVPRRTWPHSQRSPSSKACILCRRHGATRPGGHLPQWGGPRGASSSAVCLR